jgi:hypothetical protein
MATNAVENIKLIKERLHLNTQRIRNACDWHILKNYHFTLELIIATNSIEQNQTLYEECLKNIHRRFWDVFIHCEWHFCGGLRGRIAMLLNTLFPVKRAKRRLAKAAKALANDVME